MMCWRSGYENTTKQARPLEKEKKKRKKRKKRKGMKSVKGAITNTPIYKTHPLSISQIPTTQLAQMSIDSKVVELTADVLEKIQIPTPTIIYSGEKQNMNTIYRKKIIQKKRTPPIEKKSPTYEIYFKYQQRNLLR